MKNSENTSRRHFLHQLGFSSMGLALFAGFQQCKKDSDSVNPNNSPFTIMTNGSDPLFLKAKTAGNKLLELYGKRDSKGIPTSLSKIAMKNNLDDNTSTDFYYNNKSLALAVASNGVQFGFNLISSDRLILTATLADGTYQVTTAINSLNSLRLSAPSGMPFGGKGVSPRKGGKLKLRYSEKHEVQGFSTSAARMTALNTVKINTTSCGEPADGIISLWVYDNNNTKLAVLPAERISEGKYEVAIPSSIVPEVEPGLICEHLPEILSYTCDLTGEGQLIFPVCEALGLALAATLVAAEIAAPILAACPEITEGIMAICETIGASPGPGAPSIADGLCDAVLEYREFSNKLVMIAEAAAYPKSKFANSVESDAAGPYKDIQLDLGGEPTIKSFTLNPPDPAEYQSYEGTVSISCLPSASVITLSIVGTDGYEDSIDYTVSEAQTQGEYTLYVPGSYSGVQDVVTVKLALPGGKEIVRTASLVFG